MTRIAYFDCASGAAGDMLLGALVDVGLPLQYLKDALATLPLDGYRIEAAEVRRGGVRATKLDVVVDAEPTGHRHLAAILRIIAASGLDASHKQRAAALFHRLGEAEAAVHGTSVDAVHFHEVGAVDSIVDIVGAVVGLAWLDVERVYASPINVGSGTVRTQHGELPVPAPATARLIAGVPVYGAGRGERLTPTGALLLTGYAHAFGPMPAMTPRAVGYGAGTLDDPERPNVLRLTVGDAAEPAQSGADDPTYN